MTVSEAYQILGISAEASDQVVRKTFAELSRKYHPEEAPEQYRKIYEAYRTIVEDRRLRRRSGFTAEGNGQPPTRPASMEKKRPFGADGSFEEKKGAFGADSSSAEKKRPFGADNSSAEKKRLFDADSSSEADNKSEESPAAAFTVIGADTRAEDSAGDSAPEKEAEVHTNASDAAAVWEKLSGKKEKSASASEARNGHDETTSTSRKTQNETISYSWNRHDETASTSRKTKNETISHSWNGHDETSPETYDLYGDSSENVQYKHENQEESHEAVAKEKDRARDKLQETHTIPPEQQARLSTKKRRREQRLISYAMAAFVISAMLFRTSISTSSFQQRYFYPFLLLIAAVMLLSKPFGVPALSPFLGGLSGLGYWSWFYFRTDFTALEEAIRRSTQQSYANEVLQRIEQMRLSALSEQLETLRLLFYAGLLLSGGTLLLSLPFLLYQLAIHRRSLWYWERRQCSEGRLLRKGKQLDSLPPKLPESNFSGFAYTMNEDGRIIHYGRYAKGTLHGISMELDAYGLLQKVSVFSKGRPRFEILWYPSGRLMEYICFNRAGKQRRQLYAENGTLLYKDTDA